MPWLAILSALLPILLQLLKLLMQQKELPKSPRVVERLSILRRDCQDIVGHCERLGIPASNVSSAAFHFLDDGGEE